MSAGTVTGFRYSVFNHAVIVLVDCVQVFEQGVDLTERVRGCRRKVMSKLFQKAGCPNGAQNGGVADGVLALRKLGRKEDMIDDAEELVLGQL